jgi:hypothetical protein
MRDARQHDIADNLCPSFVLSQKELRNFCKSVYFSLSLFLLYLFLPLAQVMVIISAILIKATTSKERPGGLIAVSPIEDLVNM